MIASHYRYRQVWRLHREGWPGHAIARHLGLGRSTVVRYLRHETFPERKGRGDAGRSLLDPWKPAILERWNAGRRDSRRPLGELQGLGYRRSYATLARYTQMCPRTACMDAPRPARAFFADPAHWVSCCHVYGLVEVTKTSGLDGIRDRLLNKLASLPALRGNQVLPIPVRPVVPSRRRSPSQPVETPRPGRAFAVGWPCLRRAAQAGARYASPRLSTTWTIRASLLATAATVVLNGRRARRPLIQAQRDRKSTRLNSSHRSLSRMPSSA